MPFLWSLANSSVVLEYHTTCVVGVVHEYGADAFLKEKATGQLHFFQLISYGASRFLQPFFFPTGHVI